MSGDQAGAGVAVEPSDPGSPSGAEGGPTGRETAGARRHREHLFPGRPHRLTPRFDADELAAVRVAAARAGLTPTGFVAAAAVAAARGTASPSGSLPREALGELMGARRALTAFASNVNQAARVLNAGGEPPAWLGRAAELSGQAVRRIDAATVELMARLP